METKKLKKNLQRYFCIPCDFKCYMKCDWDRHIMRAKHLKCINVNNMETQKLKKTYNCHCGKHFLSNSGLWKHQNKCLLTNDSNQNKTTHNEPTDKELIMLLIKENNELKQMMMEVIKNGTHNTNSHNTNSNNKTFNLNLFLNETCKDAMNIQDFVDSITLQLSDLEKMGELGYVEGISNIITNNLKALDVTQRPIHCTDKKREILYVKDEDKWDKENNEKKKIRKAIKHIAHKNSKLIPEFKEKYPDCVKSDSKKSDQYNHLIIEAMGGQGNNDVEKENQILKNISKEITIDKYIE